MKHLRNIFLRDILLLFLGIIFLNLSFFMAEISLLKLNKKRALIEFIEKNVTGCGLEEESEIPLDQQENNFSLKDLTILFNHNLRHHNHLCRIAQKSSEHKPLLLQDLYFSEIVSPPPEG